MSLKRFYAIFHKEIRHIARDVRLLLLVTLAPAFLLLMLSYVVSYDVQHTRMVVLDMDKTSASRNYVNLLSADGDFILVGYLSDYAYAETELISGNASVALIIPRGFEDHIITGQTTHLQAIVDGVNPINARQAIAQLNARTRMFSINNLSARSAIIQLISSTSSAADVRGRAWYNSSIKSIYSMVPGLLAIVLFMPGMALTVALAREKETGSFEGLIATPVRGVEYLLGKMLAYALGGMIGAGVAIAVAVFWFQVPFRGDLLLLLGLTMLFFIATMGTGVLISNFVASQQAAMLIFLVLFFLPSFFIAGLFTPIDTTSPFSMVLANIIPPTHFIVISRAIFLKGMGVSGLLPSILALGVIGCVTLLLSLMLFKKKVR
jgi:ABC-type multidrug transport system permease subunit